MNIGILGTGKLAVALGSAWAEAGHSLLITGRDNLKAVEVADLIGKAAEQVAPDDFAARADVVIVAVAWEGLREAIALVGGSHGSLAGMTVIDCTNAVDYSTGELQETAAEVVARTAQNAHVVKALHLFAGESWPYRGPKEKAPVVAICGDSKLSLDQAGALIRDLGGQVAVIGGISKARQLEETAGFVMTVVAAGYNPRQAVPDVDPSLLAGNRSQGTADVNV
jgi:predicted dinucleotide-binding enzyme